MLSATELISLSAIPKLGARRIQRILEVFPNANNTSEFKKYGLLKAGVPEILHSNIFRMNSKIGDEALENTEKLGARFIPFYSKEYPDLLSEIYSPPIGLFVKGQMNFPSISMVGSRKPDAYGRKQCETLSEDLVHAGFCIVSGFAVGIDSIAHRAALRKGGSSIAVLGSGLGVEYPKNNLDLIRDPPDNLCFVSEFLPFVKAIPGNFPRRNRIISGLSKGTVVVQAAHRSGTFKTVMHAIDQNRDVFAIPGRIDNPLSDGTHRIIQQGAKLVHDVNDILQEYNAPAVTRPVPKLEPKEMVIYEACQEAIHIDALSNLLETDGQELLGTLLMMELDGHICQLPGKYFQVN